MSPDDGGLASVFDGSESYPRLKSADIESARGRLTLEVGEDMAWFKGHFPAIPVLPGVVQLHWAVRAAQTLFDFQGPPIRVARLKFQKVVMPPALLELQLDRAGPNQVNFIFQCQQDTHSKGCLEFDENAEC